jgi:hypothetical protein
VLKKGGSIDQARASAMDALKEKIGGDLGRAPVVLVGSRGSSARWVSTSAGNFPYACVQCMFVRSYRSYAVFGVRRRARAMR